MGLQTNVSHTPVELGNPLGRPAEVELKLSLENATRIMALHQDIVVIEDPDGDRPPIVRIGSTAGLGGDLVTIDYRTSDGLKLRVGFHLRTIAAAFIEQVDDGAPPELLALLRKGIT